MGGTAGRSGSLYARVLGSAVRPPGEGSARTGGASWKRDTPL